MSKRVLIYANDRPHSQKIKKELKKKLLLANFDLIEDEANNPFITPPDYIMTIGGDGTLLGAFHTFEKWIHYSHFVGIHTGHLGFYTDWHPDELDELIDYLHNDTGAFVSYPLLQIEIKNKEETVKCVKALNELSLRTLGGTMVCDIYIQHEFFETFRGDGVCVSTPTGSTGLNKSIGGAVIHPRVDAMQLTEMASINNRIYRTLSSPMVIAKDEVVELYPRSFGKEIVILVDNMRIDPGTFDRINVRIASERIRFGKYRHTHFWDRVENSFLGNKKEQEKTD